MPRMFPSLLFPHLPRTEDSNRHVPTNLLPRSRHAAAAAAPCPDVIHDMSMLPDDMSDCSDAAVEPTAAARWCWCWCWWCPGGDGSARAASALVRPCEPGGAKEGPGAGGPLVPVAPPTVAAVAVAVAAPVAAALPLWLQEGAAVSAEEVRAAFASTAAAAAAVGSVTAAAAAASGAVSPLPVPGGGAAACSGEGAGKSCEGPGAAAAEGGGGAGVTGGGAAAADSTAADPAPSSWLAASDRSGSSAPTAVEPAPLLGTCMEPPSERWLREEGQGLLAGGAQGLAGTMGGRARSEPGAAAVACQPPWLAWSQGSSSSSQGSSIQLPATAFATLTCAVDMACLMLVEPALSRKAHQLVRDVIVLLHYEHQFMLHARHARRLLQAFKSERTSKAC